MADSVNRIVPPSISRDRSAALGREWEKKNRDDFQRRKHEEKNYSAQPLSKKTKEDRKHAIGESEREQTKGKNIDVSV
jgi:hypothetical protein